MYRTRSFFIIMGFVYLLISLLQLFNILILPVFYVFALSFSALLISMSGLIINISEYYYKTIMVSIEVSKLYKMYDPEGQKIQIINGFTAEEVNQLYKKYYRNEYTEGKLKIASKRMQFFHKISDFLFYLAISIFLIFPFINNDCISEYIQSIGNPVTTLAFSVIGFNLYIIEKLHEFNDLENLIAKHESPI